MTHLYSCRTALSEVATIFDAVTPAAASWSAEMWPGRVGLAVRGVEGDRRIEPMTWGVLDWSFLFDRTKERRTSAWFRELFPDHVEMLRPERRCLIVLDAFAYPGGNRGKRTRTWFGFEDRPICAWAGFWTDEAQGRSFCGLIAPSNDLVEPSRAMPTIVAPEECGAWLTGDLAVAARLARRTIDSDGMYREPTEEPWGGDRGA